MENRPYLDALRLLGLARKGNLIRLGAEDVRRAITSGEASLVAVASDASPSTAQRVIRLAGERGVPAVTFLTKEEMGAGLGIESCACAAVTSSGLAAAFCRDIGRGDLEEKVRVQNSAETYKVRSRKTKGENRL